MWLKLQKQACGWEFHNQITIRWPIVSSVYRTFCRHRSLVDEQRNGDTVSKWSQTHLWHIYGILQFLNIHYEHSFNKLIHPVDNISADRKHEWSLPGLNLKLLLILRCQSSVLSRSKRPAIWLVVSEDAHLRQSSYMFYLWACKD